MKVLGSFFLQQEDPMSPVLTVQLTCSSDSGTRCMVCLLLHVGESPDVMIRNGRLLLCFRESWATWPVASLRWCTAT